MIKVKNLRIKLPIIDEFNLPALLAAQAIAVWEDLADAGRGSETETILVPLFLAPPGPNIHRTRTEDAARAA